MRTAIVVLGLALCGCCCRRTPPCAPSRPLLSPTNSYPAATVTDSQIVGRYAVRSSLLPDAETSWFEIDVRASGWFHFCFYRSDTGKADAGAGRWKSDGRTITFTTYRPTDHGMVQDESEMENVCEIVPGGLRLGGSPSNPEWAKRFERDSFLYRVAN